MVRSMVTPAPLIFPSHDPASCLQISESQITMLNVTREGLVQICCRKFTRLCIYGYKNVKEQNSFLLV